MNAVQPPNCSKVALDRWSSRAGAPAPARIETTIPEASRLRVAAYPRGLLLRFNRSKATVLRFRAGDAS